MHGLAHPSPIKTANERRLPALSATSTRRWFFGLGKGRPMRLPALIFDFGNVVAFFDYLKACNRLGARLALDGDTVRRRLLERGFAQTLARLESGQMAPRDFAEKIMASLGLSLAFDDFARDWEDIFWLNGPVAGLIAALKSAQ